MDSFAQSQCACKGLWLVYQRDNGNGKTFLTLSILVLAVFKLRALCS